MQLQLRRVVVTGLGLCTPLGCGVELVWKRILLGHSGIKALPDKPEFKQLPSRVAGFVPLHQKDAPLSQPGELNAEKYVKKSEMRMMFNDSVMAVAAATDALTDARWLVDQRPSEEDSYATGVSVGHTGTSGAVPYIIKYSALLQQGKYRQISPYLIPQVLPNIPAGLVSIKHQLLGPNHCVSTACASGLHAIGDSSHMIARGACDVMVAGSSDCSLNPVILAGFSRAKALCTQFNDAPQKASRPFDAKRAGFVPSEGAGAVVLEELEHAKKRNAPIYAEILGYGMSSDGYHITAPVEDGSGAARAMHAALKDAGARPESVGLVSAHATSTPLGDLAETKAIRQVLGDSAARDALVYAPKGCLGHLLGAAGTVETVLAILSVYKGLVPSNLNLEDKEPEFDLRYVNEPDSGPVVWHRKDDQPRMALKNSFGFGGTNASLCIREYVDS